jgi:DNA-binding NtrC family response regulator
VQPDVGKRLLLVDDEPSIRSAFATLLSREGYVVETAATAEAGERALARGRVDCLILDYRIPDVRGDLFYEYAQSVQPHLRQRTVFITGDIAAATHEALDATDCQVLLKPFDVETLLSAITICLRLDGADGADGEARAQQRG